GQAGGGRLDQYLLAGGVAGGRYRRLHRAGHVDHGQDPARLGDRAPARQGLLDQVGVGGGGGLDRAGGRTGTADEADTGGAVGLAQAGLTERVLERAAGQRALQVPGGAGDLGPTARHDRERVVQCRRGGVDEDGCQRYRWL